MSRKIATFTDVAEHHLCTGCGACAYLLPDHIRMVDDVETGRRPMAIRPEPRDTELLEACPGLGLTHDEGAAEGTEAALFDLWGPVLEVWEGHAEDPEVRYAGSSGGAATAIASYCLEVANMHGVLHTAARADAPYVNETVLSRSRAELLAAAGSRYAPASPCEGLDEIERAPGLCVFIGKPCDVAAATRVARLRPALAEQLGLTVAMFCAGTPSTRGTLEMLATMGVLDPNDVVSLRYRGNGWPGNAEARTTRGGAEAVSSLSYEESWGAILQRHRQWRCHVCADHTGEFADIAVGDPWYRPIEPGEPGRSLIIARTERGRRFVREAMASGYLVLKPANPDIIAQSQPNLVATRGAVWGRMLACRLIGVAAPRYRNMATFPTWLHALTPRQRFQSIAGTFRRIVRRRLYRRRPVVPAAGQVPFLPPPEGSSPE